VSFHAHPDDEALLVAGSLARAAAAGHRVVLVVATDGESGLAADDPDDPGLGSTRAAELARSAEAIGCARVVRLGYRDSGLHGEVADGFAHQPVDGPAARLAAILQEEAADVLTGYDRNGGYGHPDHVQVHHVARRAAALAGTPRLLEATVDRTALLRVLRPLHRWHLVPRSFDPARLERSYAEPSEITVRVDVRAQLDAKRAAMRAHASQAGGGSGVRTLAFFLRLPRPLYRWVFGTEWYADAFSRGAGPSVQGQRPSDLVRNTEMSASSPAEIEWPNPW
jgi:LmbE family N-acetylglucosaminyl deacetylase